MRDIGSEGRNSRFPNTRRWERSCRGQRCGAKGRLSERWRDEHGDNDRQPRPCPRTPTANSTEVRERKDRKRETEKQTNKHTISKPW